MTPSTDNFASPQWHIRADTTYLNHGSFGPPGKVVRQARANWQRLLDEQPMDFFVRRLDPAFDAVLATVAEFIGTQRSNLIPADNATVAMNIVAHSFPLQGGDRVLLTNHEYGAVEQIWQRKCDQFGADLTVVELPFPISDRSEVVDAVVAKLDERTRLVVISHITSPTGIVLPVSEICEAAREAGVAICVDGPHAVCQIPLELDRLDCDYYTGSGHKWLSAPFGSGFLYVHPRRQRQIRTPIVSWGRQPARNDWDDPFMWWGTRDPAAVLAMSDAIHLMRSLGLAEFRQRTNAMALGARRRIIERFGAGLQQLTEQEDWFASMSLSRLPDGDAQRLQEQLWREYRIEVLIIDWLGKRWIRISCHWYNSDDDLDRLLSALGEVLDSET